MKFLKIFFFFLLSITIFSQEKFYYTGKNYGSEALFNPVNVILNGSYDIIQLEGRPRDIFNYNYRKNTNYFFRNLGRPLYSISKYGYGNFIKNEVLPLTFKKRNAQWWPNYQLHLVGGGMTYVAMSEWYELHGFPAPKVFSIGTLFVYHSLNEIRELDGYGGINVDPIADIYIFDLGGIILFGFDGVSKFFKEELNLADWSLQPSFASDGTLQNNGQYFSVKWKTPLSDKVSFFYYFGMNALTGASYKVNDEEAISAGFGLRARNLEVVKQTGRQFQLITTWNFGFFYDKNNSLMSSILFSGLTDYFCNINIYPGMIKYGGFSPGLWCVFHRNGNVLLGLTTVYAPGLGLTFN